MTRTPSSPLPPGTPPAIRVRGLTRHFEVPGRADVIVKALDGVDLDLRTGSFSAIVGAPGSGKSTLLHCLAGLDEPTSGQIVLLGAPLTQMRPAERAAFRARRVGFVFQDYNLISSLTAAENVSLPARLAGAPLRRTDVDAALTRVGLAHRAGLKPHRLSGGERQRVAVARVMAGRPQIVFADEPTGALDLEAAGVVLDWLGELARQGTTVVMVTHDVEAAARADEVVVMSQGRLAGRTAGGDALTIAGLVHAGRC